MTDLCEYLSQGLLNWQFGIFWTLWFHNNFARMTSLVMKRKKNHQEPERWQSRQLARQLNLQTVPRMLHICMLYMIFFCIFSLQEHLADKTRLQAWLALERERESEGVSKNSEYNMMQCRISMIPRDILKYKESMNRINLTTNAKHYDTDHPCQYCTCLKRHGFSEVKTSTLNLQTISRVFFKGMGHHGTLEGHQQLSDLVIDLDAWVSTKD